MKSVVAEASSIAKAIELAWQKAGQPKEFLIKVFQEPQRNMFGLTKTSAKVGIFFDDAAMVQKIKHAAQTAIPANYSTTPINASKQITPIKPIQTKNSPTKVQQPVKNAKTAPKSANTSQTRPHNQPSKKVVQPNNLPINTAEAKAPVLATPIVNPENPAQATQNNQTPNANKPKRRYYHRRKPRSPRPNGEATQAAAPVNKSDN